MMADFIMKSAIFSSFKLLKPRFNTVFNVISVGYEFKSIFGAKSSHLHSLIIELTVPEVAL